MHIIFAYFSTNKVIQNVVFINNKLRNQWLLQEIELSLFSMGSFVTVPPWVIFNHCFWQRRFMSVEKLERIFYNPQIGISEYSPFSTMVSVLQYRLPLPYSTLYLSTMCIYHLYRRNWDLGLPHLYQNENKIYSIKCTSIYLYLDHNDM